MYIRWQMMAPMQRLKMLMKTRMNTAVLLFSLLLLAGPSYCQPENRPQLHGAAIERLIQELKPVYDTSDRWRTIYLAYDRDYGQQNMSIGRCKVVLLNKSNLDSIFRANGNHLTEVSGERVRIKAERAKIVFSIGPTIGKPSEKRFGIYLKARSRLFFRYNSTTAMWVCVKAKTHIRKGRS
jgi:hypothetical protein